MTESSESPTASPDVIELTAPLIFGPLFDWALYGILVVQIYVYSYNFPRDRRSLKILAYFVFVLETVRTALNGSDVYYWFVAGFGNVEQPEISHFVGIDIAIITAVVSLTVQGYFCHRIWTLNGWSSWVCWIIAVAAVTQSGTAVDAGIKALLGGKYAVSKTEVFLWSILSALVDVLIAAGMTSLLRRTNSKFSNFVLIRVVRITIETNTLTASLAIMTLVLYAVFPNKLYYVFTSEIIGKVYSNTLLVSLNNRIYFRDHQPPGHGDSADFMPPDRVRATARTSLSFAIPEPDSFQLRTITQTVELGMGEGDDTIVNSSLSCPTKSHLFPDDHESTVDNFRPTRVESG